MVPWLAGITALYVLSTPADAATPAPDTLLAAAGLRPLDPGPAPPFSLEDLNGTPRSLADTKDRWVLLTFFATWCGPCATEMPSLQRLHEALAPEGLEVLGVSLDRNPGVVPRFLQRHKARFPVLVDPKGITASPYQASAIPVSYLIAPGAQRVAVARGAREWDRAIQPLRQLIQLAPGTPADPSAPPKPPPEPPTAQAALQQTTVHPGDEATVRVRVQWTGDLADYVLHPPLLPEVEGVEVGSTSAHTDSDGGKQVIDYDIGVTAARAGVYSLGPVEVRFTPAGQFAPMATQVPGPTLMVEDASSLWPLALGGGAGLVLVAGAGGWLWTRRTAGAEPDDDGLADALLAAQRQRLEGDMQGFIESIRTILTRCGDDPSDLDDLTEQIRYGAHKPPRAVLDRLHKRAATAIDRHHHVDEADDL